MSEIYEKLYRNVGIDPALNERARNGYYISDVQDRGSGFDVMGAWAQAGQAPRGPDFGTASNKANMFSLEMKYHYDKQTALYLTAATIK